MWRRDKNGVTYFLYDGLNLIAELWDDFRTKITFVYGLGIDARCARRCCRRSRATITRRSRGSITHLIDAGAIAAATVYLGCIWQDKTRQRTVANPFAYTGRELDPTGLYYFRARYYDAELGRFLSRDLGCGAARRTARSESISLCAKQSGEVC